MPHVSLPSENYGAIVEHVDRKEKSTMGVRPQRRASIVLDVWSQTLASLVMVSPGQAGNADSHVHCDRLTLFPIPRDVAPCLGARAKVQVLDRPSKTTAIISWLDPTVCCYGDQFWRSCKSRQAGMCALTGFDIRRGDRIYRPRNIRPCPMNANAMILAKHLEASRD